MALSAAELQKRHELEGSPDPFPSLSEYTGPAPTAPSRSSQSPQENLDTGSHELFPSLSPVAVPTQAQSTTSAWSVRPRIKASGVTESFILQDIDLSSAGKDGRPTTLSEVTRGITQKFKVKIEASTNHRKETTFYLKSESQKELDKAKEALVAVCSPVVTLTVQAPASTISFIIGTKGATLKQIRERTSVRVDIPPKDGLTPANSNATLTTNGTTPSASGTTTPLVIEQDEQEVNIPITIKGARPRAEEARRLINEIITSRTCNITQKIREIPPHILPFLIPRRAAFEAAAEGHYIQTSLSAAAREITVTGDREGVIMVVDAIKSGVENLGTVLTSASINFAKRQHRLLTGGAAEEILTQRKCVVIVPEPEDPSEAVMVWGGSEDLPHGLAAVIAKANSVYIHEFPLPGPIQTSKNILTYILRANFTDVLTTAHPGLNVFTPPPALWDSGTTLNLELSGSKNIVDEAIRHTSELIGKLNGATKDLNVDWTVHKFISRKNAKRLEQLRETHNVLVFFPPESLEQSSLLLVYDPTSPSASPSPLDKSKNLEDVANEILKMTKQAADVKSQLIQVEKKWHSAIIGKSSATLDAIIGEDISLSIKFGADAGGSTEDFIMVKGLASDVDRAIKEIRAAVENAIENSFSTEFKINQGYVGRIVGAGGAQINKMRDSLGVVIHFDQEPESFKESSKKKKEKPPQITRVKITGRKENVEEAKKRILNQVEQYADETSEVLKIPRQYHSSLIGQNGKYVTRLEDKYGVKITFPREATDWEGKTRETLTPDEVLVKGGKKGVAGAKAELLDALEFEKENDHMIQFTVPTRAIARILGKGGARINEIKDNTGAQIDVDKSFETEATITVRGNKQGIKEAQAMILEIASTVPEETIVDIMIENKFHRSLIGAGGQGLKDLIVRCGGPTDPKLQAGLVRFPRQGEPSEDVRIRGEPRLVQKIKAELEAAVEALRDRIVLGADIPAAQYRTLIGRGGQHLNELQKKYSVIVQFPGSRSYSQGGEPENAAEIADAEPANVVRVYGPRAAVEKAIDELKSHVREPAPDSVTAVILVPAKYHHAVTQQGNIFRTLRSFGAHVEHSNLPTKAVVPTPPPGAASARIDEPGEDEEGIQWHVVVNYSEGEEGDVEWTVKARDQDGLDRARQTIEEALEHAKTMTHVGFLTMPDRKLFPRIVGSRGANVSRLRAETGADITVSREDNSIVIAGSEEAVEAAKKAILEIKNGGPGKSGRD